MKGASNEYYLFNLSGGRIKIKVLLSDILLVIAIKGSHIDKQLYLKGNIIHIIRRYSFEEIMLITGFLLRVNKHELVSPEIVDTLEEETIYLKGLTGNDMPKFVSLNGTYRKAFLVFFRCNEGKE